MLTARKTAITDTCNVNIFVQSGCYVPDADCMAYICVATINIDSQIPRPNSCNRRGLDAEIDALVANLNSSAGIARVVTCARPVARVYPVAVQTVVTGRAHGCVIGIAGPRTVTRVRVGAGIVSRIAAGRASRVKAIIGALVARLITFSPAETRIACMGTARVHANLITIAERPIVWAIIIVGTSDNRYCGTL